MGEFIYTVALAAAIGGIISSVCPKGEFSKYVKFACAISLLIAVIAPISSALKKIPDMMKLQKSVINENAYEYNVSGNELIEKKTKSYLAEQIHRLIREKTGISAFSSECDFEFSESGILRKVNVILHAESHAAYSVLELKKDVIESYISGITVCEVKVEVDEK